MKSIALERIAVELAVEEGDVVNQSKFCVEDELAASDLNIDVIGAGKVIFPINNEYIKKLISVSSEAKFGLHDKTVLDKNVRDTHEIKSDQLQVTINEFSLNRILSNMKKALGLADNCAVTSRLHNMLIYSENNFFKQHKDTEKVKNMIATLVIVLPTPHIGGKLKIQHGKNKFTFSTQNVDATNAKCISFYSDCVHEITKIKGGHRICLTYNLILQTVEFFTELNVSSNQNLKNAIMNYFDMKTKPTKLVYVFDHSYSEFGLKWDMLKGNDRINAFRIYNVANMLELVPYLALVDIVEYWNCDDSNYYNESPELIELDSDNIHLSYWIDKNNKIMPFKECDIDDSEICWTKETKSFEYEDKEFQGYTGNEGATMELLYKRAGIVLWPKSNEIRMNFKLNYNNALKELCILTHSAGNKEKVLEIIKAADEYLNPGYAEEEQVNYFVTFSTIALYIEDEKIATFILSHFKWKILCLDIAESLVNLQKQYGLEWVTAIFNKWKSETTSYNDCNILENIDSFGKNFLKFGGDAQIVELILNIQSDAICTKRVYYEFNRWSKQEKNFKILKHTFILCAENRNVKIVNNIITHVLSDDEAYPKIDLAELYIELQEVLSSEYLFNLQHLKNQLIEILGSELSNGSRAANDWSIPVKLPCNCKNCEVAMKFLNSKTEITKIWPINAQIRSHISSEIRSKHLPVELNVQAIGTPHKLVMVKKETLHTDARKRTKKLKFLYKKLIYEPNAVEIDEPLGKKIKLELKND